jgi:RNA polymerase primary sigma factor
MRQDYRIAAMRNLRDQLRYAPRDTKLAQAERAESLLHEIVADKVYTYEYVCFRITEFRPTQCPRIKMTGTDLLHDLRLLIEDLSDAADLEIGAVSEPVWTVEDLSRRFQVSTKTIARWRDQGLVSRRFVVDGRKRIGFLESSVAKFVAQNRERVARGARFSHLTDEEREMIIDRARHLEQAGGSPSEVTRRLAQRLGRSVETIRYTLKQFNREHPEMAVFAEASGPLSAETRRRIFQEYRRGTTIEALAKKYCRTRSSIYRVINEMRAQRILELPLDYMPSPEFERRDAEEIILAPMPEAETAQKRVRIPAGLPPYLASLYEIPLLTREQEQHLFRKFNYLKYKAARLREQVAPHGRVDPSAVRSGLLDEIERLYDQSVAVKNEIVRRNLRLVVSIAKRHVSGTDGFFELVSDGNMSLIRAVEKFDYTRGNKFSTYATWAIMKNFARTIPDEHRHRERFRTSFDEMFGATQDTRSDQLELEQTHALRVAQVDRILRRLDDREQRIIISRYGLRQGSEPRTLKEVGQELGVTKERVRQIEARAINKLRRAAQEEHIEPPEVD